MVYFILIAGILVILFGAYMTGILFNERALNMQSVASRGNKTITKNTQNYEYPPYTPGIRCQNPTSWILNESHYRNIFIQSEGLRLHAVYVEYPGSHKYVINCHGYGSRAINGGPFLHKFYLEGFNVLGPDARAHGESEGVFSTMGFRERFDIMQWIAYIIDNDADAQIVLYGTSMGASTIMFAVGEQLPPNVKCAIADCGYSSLWNQYAYECRHTFHIPTFPILYCGNAVSVMRNHFNYRRADTTSFLARSKTPMLFIHGGKDTYVPIENLKRNYDACKAEKEMLVIEEATHARSSSFEPEKYWNTVFAFISRHLDVK